jgi:hypothetical protein
MMNLALYRGPGLSACPLSHLGRVFNQYHPFHRENCRPLDWEYCWAVRERIRHRFET